MATLRTAQRESRVAVGGEPGPPVEVAEESLEWPDYMAPCLLLLDLLAKPSNLAQGAELQQRQRQRQQQQSVRMMLGSVCACSFELRS